MLSEDTASDLGFLEIMLYDAYIDMATSGALPGELQEMGDDWRRIYTWKHAWEAPNDEGMSEIPLDEELIKTTIRQMARAYLGIGGAGSS